MPTLPILAELELDGQKLDISYYLSHDYDDISAAANELPSVIEWINERHSALMEAKLVKKAEIDEAEATAYFALNGAGDDNFEGNYAGKKTEASLAHAVAIDPAVKRAKREYANISAWTTRLAGLMNSLQSRLELLRSSEATRRKVFDEQTGRE